MRQRKLNNQDVLFHDENLHVDLAWQTENELAASCGNIIFLWSINDPK